MFKYEIGQIVSVGKRSKEGTVLKQIENKIKKGIEIKYLVEYKITPKANRPKEVWETQINGVI